MTRQYIVAGLAAALIVGGLFGSAPLASAGCMYGGFGAISRCDDPVQPDGTWQRCMVYEEKVGSLNDPIHRCFLMGPGQNPPAGVIFNIYPEHIDD